MRIAAFALAIMLAVVLVTTRAAAGPDTGPSRAEDPFAWLEDVDGARAMGWVRAENAKTAALLEADPRYPVLLKEALAIAEAKDRIPDPSIIGGQILNYWQDVEHVRGVWRRTSLTSYQQSAPAWTTVLDLDALAAGRESQLVLGRCGV